MLPMLSVLFSSALCIYFIFYFIFTSHSLSYSLTLFSHTHTSSSPISFHIIPSHLSMTSYHTTSSNIISPSIPSISPNSRSHSPHSSLTSFLSHVISCHLLFSSNSPFIPSAVRVMMITGDSKETAVAIARDVNIFGILEDVTDSAFTSKVYSTSALSFFLFSLFCTFFLVTYFCLLPFLILFFSFFSCLFT